MAAGKIVVVSIALAVALLVALFFPPVILPLLPPLRPLASQLLVRLRDVFAFLAFTTAIAAGIFSSQRKDATSSKKRKPFLEHHPLGSIFGEPGHGETEHLQDTGEDVATLSPITKKMETRHGVDFLGYSISSTPSAMDNGSLLQKRVTRLSMEASQERKLPISKEENGAPKLQKKLHRKSSSLDDSVSFEPELDASRPGTPESSPLPTTFGKQKTAKKVSFSVTSSPTSESPDGVPKRANEDTTERQSDVVSRSPGDLTRQADAFIAKFKEQMRLQRLESAKRRQGGL